MKKSKRKSFRKRKFGPLPPFPPKVDNYSTQKKIGTVVGSLAIREVYLDHPEYNKLAEKIKNNTIKEIRNDTMIKSIVKFLRGQGYNVSPRNIEELMFWYNIASILSRKM